MDEERKCFKLNNEEGELVEFVESEKAEVYKGSETGRRTYAMKDYAVGDTLMRSRQELKAVEVSEAHSFCHYCLGNWNVPLEYECERCFGNVMYCNPGCQGLDKELHPISCGIIRKYMSSLIRLVY